MAIDWWNVGTKAADWYLKDKQINDAQDNLLGGIKGARQDIKEYSQPYQDMATWGMEGYKQEGPFDFTHEGYLQSPEYQWLQDQATQQVERSAAAGPTGLYSGQTLADLQDRGHMVAAQEYGAEHARQLAAQQSRENYWWKPVSTGAVLAGQTGQALADLSAQRGGIRSKYEAQEDQAFHDMLQGVLGSTADPKSVATKVKQIYDSLGGAAGVGQSITDFTKDLMGDSELLKELDLGELAGKAWDWATGAGAAASTAVEGWKAVPGMADGMFMNDAGFIVDMSTQAGQATAQAVATGTEVATTGAMDSLKAAGSKAMSFLSTPTGMGLTAAAATLIMGGDIKDAAINGGATYLGAAIGAAIFPGVGALVGGALGGLVANMGLSDEPAKTDSVMMLSPSTDGFKRDAYAEGPWGNIGFKGSATRHLDGVNKQYLPAFETIAKIDTVVSNALTDEENQAIMDAIGDSYTYRKESNEGKISPKRVVKNTIKDRAMMVREAIGEERWQELELYDVYNSILSGITDGNKSLDSSYA